MDCNLLISAIELIGKFVTPKKNPAKPENTSDGIAIGKDAEAGPGCIAIGNGARAGK